MEELLTMNTNIIRKYWSKDMAACLLTVTLSLFASSCSESDLTEDSTTKSQLRFEVGGSTNTRVSYNGLHSTFDEDELIGSVIADISNGNCNFKSAAKWKYSNGILMLQDDGYNNQLLTTDEAGNLTLKDNNTKYAFYFFYPVGANLPENQEEWKASYWKKYQASIETSQNTKENLNKSDFLWIKYDEGVKASDQPQKTVSLVFKKKFATIEVDAETPLTNVSFINTNGTLITKKADLQTGELSDLTFQTWEQNTAQYKQDISPYKFDTDGKSYRLSIPPQDISGLHLKFTFRPNDYDQNIDIDLSERLQKVEEGKIYYIKINKAGDPSIIILDWEYGKYSILEENGQQ